MAVFQPTSGPVGTFEAKDFFIEQLKNAMTSAHAAGAQFIVTPELYLTGYSMKPETAHKMADEVGNSIYLQKVSEMAKLFHMGVALAYPELAHTENGIEYFDAITVFNQTGHVAYTYRKTHLYGQAERDLFSAGDEFFVTKINGVGVGALNCYEAEFPEISRILALKGAQVLIAPTAADRFYRRRNGEMAQVAYPDVSDTHCALRAYENRAFFAYINRSGREVMGGSEWIYQGNSIINSPLGTPVVKAWPEPSLLIADLVPQDWGISHPEEPVYNYLHDRRPELYSILTEEL